MSAVIEVPRKRIIPRVDLTRCWVAGCNRPIKARTFCSRHYSLWQRYGDPCGGEGTKWDLKREFLEQVLADFDNGLLDPETCVINPWHIEPYGEVVVDGVRRRVHVVACEHRWGPRPPGLEVCHSCCESRCLSPWHLRWDTHLENVHDEIRLGKTRAGVKLDAATVRLIREEWAKGVFAERVGPPLRRLTGPHQLHRPPPRLEICQRRMKGVCPIPALLRGTHDDVVR